MTAKVPSPMTLATLLEQVAAAPSLGEQRRAEIRSAINTLCRVLGREPHLVPAAARDLQKTIRDALPAAADVSGKRWRNCKTLLRQAMALTDPATIPARSTHALLPEWQALLDHPDAAGHRRGLSRFSRWCSASAIPPQEVTQTAYERFRDDLAEHCLVRCPVETQQTAGRAWNAAREAVPGWPAITLVIASRRRNLSLPWSAFSPSLEAEVERYLERRSRDDLRFDVEPVRFRPSTIKSKRALLRQFASAIVEHGIAAEKLSGLADLITYEHAHAGLTVLARRAGNKPTGRLYGIACLLLALARHEVDVAPPVIAYLKGFCQQLKPRTSGMTAKNRERLRQFDDPRQLDLYLTLPARLWAAARKITDPTTAEALLAEEAIAFEILQFAPLRISNIAALEIGRTLILSGGVGHIVVGREEVKNDVDLQLPLPAGTVDMLNAYIRRFHPLLAPAGCHYLFPGGDGGHRSPVAFSTKLSRRVRTDFGAVFNVHLARHLAAKLYLEANPGAYGVVKLLLGHKSIDTTTRIYCGTETDAAFRAHSQLVERYRGRGAGR